MAKFKQLHDLYRFPGSARPLDSLGEGYQGKRARKGSYLAFAT